MNFRYGLAARFFHWATALLVLVMFVFGIWISKFEPKDEAFKMQLYNLHESFGILLFVLVLFRLLVRFGNPPAALEDQPALIRFGAHANHVLLYVLLLVQPVLGFLDTNAWGFPVKWFGLFSCPLAHRKAGRGGSAAIVQRSLFCGTCLGGVDRHASVRRSLSRHHKT